MQVQEFTAAKTVLLVSLLLLHNTMVKSQTPRITFKRPRMWPMSAESSVYVYDTTNAADITFNPPAIILNPLIAQFYSPSVMTDKWWKQKWSNSHQQQQFQNNDNNNKNNDNNNSDNDNNNNNNNNVGNKNPAFLASVTDSEQFSPYMDVDNMDNDDDSNDHADVSNSVSNSPDYSDIRDKYVTGENSTFSEQLNNSATLEYLPTIAVPFLDTITHGIITELQQHVQLIKPGTKWCGDGNKARSYNDVGVLYKTDKCCRTHDKCPYYILAREMKYGLYNDGHFTRSHCDCDAAFYNCLKKVNSPFSTGVGVTYFNILRMKCFRLEYPVVMCSQRVGLYNNF